MVMTGQDEKMEHLRRFFEEIARVMDQFEDVSRNFVLAEADSADMAATREAATKTDATLSSMATAELLSIAEPPRRKVCIRFGIDPRTGQRVCLQWVDMR
jgi:hypothetical protein